jgi:hypothetical protein
MESQEERRDDEPEHGNPDTPFVSGISIMEGERRPDSSNMRVNPRPYNGTTSWRSYKSQFERISRINRWSDEQKLDFLWVNLTGSALTYVESLAEERTYCYRELCEALEERFGDSQLAEVFKSELRSRQRKEGESLPSLAQDINSLVQRAYPEIGQQGVAELAVEQFREALPDHEQRMAVFRCKARTIDQAVKAAIDAESWQISEKRRTPAHKVRAIIPDNLEQEYAENEIFPRSRGVRLTEPQASQDQMMKKLTELVDKLNSEETTPSQQLDKRPPPKCYYCQKLGHIQRDCKKRRADAQRSQSGNEQRQH